MIPIDPDRSRDPSVITVALSIPNLGYTQPEAYCNRLCNMQAMTRVEERGKVLNTIPRFEFYLTVMGRMFTPVAREEAAKMAIESHCDYLFFIDDDMLCPDDLFERLWAHHVDIVAPLAFTRNPPHKPVLYQCVEGYDPVCRKEYFLNHTVMHYPKDTLVECDAVGFGAALITRSALEAVPPPRFMSTCGSGEDIYFCFQARKHGCRIFMDTATKLGHLGHPLVVDEAYVESLRRADPLFLKKHTVSGWQYATNGQTPTEPVVVLGD